MAHSFEIGTRAWQPDPTEGWVASEVVDRIVEGDKLKLVFSLENGEVSTVDGFDYMGYGQLTLDGDRRKRSKRPKRDY